MNIVDIELCNNPSPEFQACEDLSLKILIIVREWFCNAVQTSPPKYKKINPMGMWFSDVCSALSPSMYSVDFENKVAGAICLLRYRQKIEVIATGDQLYISPVRIKNS